MYRIHFFEYLFLNPAFNNELWNFIPEKRIQYCHHREAEQ